MRLFRPKGHFRPRVLLPRSDTPALEVAAFGAPASRKSQPERAGTVETCGHLKCKSITGDGRLAKTGDKNVSSVPRRLAAHRRSCARQRPIHIHGSCLKSVDLHVRTVQQKTIDAISKHRKDDFWQLDNPWGGGVQRLLNAQCEKYFPYRGLHSPIVCQVSCFAAKSKWSLP